MSQLKKIKIIKVLIFDLDGVLIDSKKNMRLAINEINKKMNLNIQYEEYKKFLGLPFEQIMKKLCITKNVEMVKKNYQFYSSKYIHNISINNNLLLELKILKKKYLLSVFTSKDRLRCLKILKKYKLFDYFVTSDDVKKGKPNPEGLIKIMNKFKVMRKECIFFGDSIYDYRASKAANISYIHAEWGYGKFNNTKKKIIRIKKYTDIKKIISAKEKLLNK